MVTKNQKVTIDALAQGVLDVTEEKLPVSGGSMVVEVPLHRPKFQKTVGHVKLELRA